MLDMSVMSELVTYAIQVAGSAMINVQTNKLKMGRQKADNLTG
jgi:hypothetical protein